MRFLTVIASILIVGCASSDIRNWNSENRTGRIVVFSGKNLLSTPTIEDVHDELIERCPSGYRVQKEGWQGSGITLSRAKDSEPNTTTSSINVGGREVFSVMKSKESKSGNDTVVKLGDFQTERSSDGKSITVVRSPIQHSGSQEGTAKYFDFKCK